jgi:hypothetical protein
MIVLRLFGALVRALFAPPPQAVAGSKSLSQTGPSETVATPPASGEAELEFVWRAFTNLNDWVRFSDTKAAAVLAADGVIVASIATLLAGSHTSVFQRPLAIIWLAAIVIAAFYSAVNALTSISPRLKTSEESSSLVFYMDIDRGYPSSAAFTKTLREALANPDRAVTEIGQQVWANSKVASLKYRFVAKALNGLACAVYLGFTGILVLAVIRLAGSL